MSIRYELDPFRKFTHLGSNHLYALIGQIPIWLDEEYTNFLSAEEVFESRYPFPMSELEGKIVNDLYVSKFKEDPKLYPLVKLYRGKEVILQYDFAIVAVIREDGTQHITRMD